MRGCKRIIGVDGCHLKTAFGGILLSVVAMDTNNGVLPLAICICETENKDSWSCFFSLLKEHIGLCDGMALTIMSDRQKGLIVICATKFPNAHMRYCVRHVYDNF